MACGVLAEFLKEFYPGGVRLIFGCMRDKKYEEMLTLLRPHAREMILTKGSSARFMEPSALLELVPGAHVEPSLPEAIAYARAKVSPEETILVCGSLYLIGEARVLLQ
jgi:dihydrofolate synthase/folylpolyglutamate synthase